MSAVSGIYVDMTCDLKFFNGVIQLKDELMEDIIIGSINLSSVIVMVINEPLFQIFVSKWVTSFATLPPSLKYLIYIDAWLPKECTNLIT